MRRCLTLRNGESMTDMARMAYGSMRAGVVEEELGHGTFSLSESFGPQSFQS